MQDIESDTGYDTRRRAPDGALARLSQTQSVLCVAPRRDGAGVRPTDHRRGCVQLPEPIDADPLCASMERG